MNDSQACECPRCGYSTPYRHSLLAHFRRKKPCPHPPHRNDADRDTIDEVIALDLFNENQYRNSRTQESALACDGCCRKFSFRSALSRHRRLCTGGGHHHACTQVVGSADAARVSELQKRCDELEKQMEDIRKRPMSTTNSNNNNSYNNSYNVQINALGNEDLTRITPELIDTCIRRTTKGLVELMEKIHFDTDVPSNHNLRASLQHPDHIRYHDGEGWVYGPRNRVVRDVVNSSHNIMSNRYDDSQQEMRKSMSNAMYEFVDRWMNKMTKSNAQMYVDVMSEMYCALLNKTDRVFGSESSGDI